MLDRESGFQEGQTHGQAVEGSIRRIRSVWRSPDWTPALIAEYRRVLARLEDADLIQRVVDQVIDDNPQRSVPPPGVFVRTGRDIKATTRNKTPSARQSIDELALRDALECLGDIRMGRTDLFTEAELREQIASIRKRLGRA